MSYHGPLPGDDGDDDVSPARVALIMLAQAGSLASLALRIIAIPLSLLLVLTFLIAWATAKERIDAIIALTMLPFSAALVLMAPLSFVYRSLRAPVAILTVLIPVVTLALIFTFSRW